MKQILSSMMLFMLLLVGTSAVQAQETEKELTREEKKRQCRQNWTACSLKRQNKR